MPKKRDYINRVPVYGELKVRRNISLTDTAWDGLEALASLSGLPSKSEFIERLCRGMLAPQDLQEIYKIFLKKG